MGGAFPTGGAGRGSRWFGSGTEAGAVSLTRGAIFGALLGRCPPPGRFAPPWDFVPPPGECRAPVADPAGALAALREDFADADLVAAGVLDCPRGAAPRLAAALCNPAGALVPLLG